MATVAVQHAAPPHPLHMYAAVSLRKHTTTPTSNAARDRSRAAGHTGAHLPRKTRSPERVGMCASQLAWKSGRVTPLGTHTHALLVTRAARIIHDNRMREVGLLRDHEEHLNCDAVTFTACERSNICVANPMGPLLSRRSHIAERSNKPEINKPPAPQSVFA